MKTSSYEEEERLPIDHTKIMDGFGQLSRSKYYQAFYTNCGICNEKTFVTAKTQKYILEVKIIPVKMLQRGAVFCKSCTKRRGRINYLKKGNKFLKVENGRVELTRLRDEEQKLKSDKTSF